MSEEMTQEALLFQHAQGDHIFYCTDELEGYIENVEAFVAEGIGRNEHIILVENVRIFPKIQEKLALRFTKEQLEKVHHYNSFDFYWKNENFHTPTVLAHFEELTFSWMKAIRSVHGAMWNGEFKTILKKI